MWESIVERLLEKYLSKYIEGIEKEKLRVGVLRGDVELEDLKVKKTALDDSDLGVSILYGNVGRLSIGISWTKWMSQDFNLRLKIKNVHILLKPCSRDSSVSEEQLKERIRDIKEKQVIRLQKIFIEAIKRTTRSNDDSTNTTFLMNFTSRLIRNIEIDIMDVHVAFHDPSRNFTLGCELIIGSLQSATLNKVAELLVKNKIIGKLTEDFVNTAENVSQCVEFRGFSVYVGLSRIPEWNDIIEASTRHDPELLKKLVTSLLTRIQTSLGVTDHDALEEQSNLHTTIDQDSGNPLEFENKEREKERTFLNMQYILLPLHLSFLFTSISTRKHIIGLFQIHKESQGIVIGKTHLKVLLELLREVAEYRDMYQRLLMPEKNKIKMASAVSLEETREIFCGLFKKKIREDAKIATSRQTLSNEERESLTFYHDFLGIRNLAKWRAACYMDETRLLAAKQSQVEEEIAQARKQQTWWIWATKGSEDIQAKILEKLQQESDSILTSDERKFVSEEILNKFSDDFVEGPYIYELSFELQNFHILIHDTDVFIKKKKIHNNEKTRYKTEKPFLHCNLHQVQAHIWINSCLDREDKEAYEWRWKFCMSGFHILHRNHTIVVLKGDSHKFEDTKLKTDPGNFQDLRHVVLRGATIQNKQKSVDDNRKPLHERNTKEEDFDNSNSLATVWNFERRINKVKNELHIFIRMAPLNCFMYQHLLRKMISFTHSILGSTTERTEKEPMSMDKSVHEHVFSDGVSENYELLRRAARNESQDLINIHMLLCAPIVYYKTSNNSGFIVHFGELCIDTQEPCTLQDLKIQAKLNSTQVYCSLHQNEIVLPLLRPVSISVYAHYNAAATHMRMDVVLHEVFIELNFLAIEIILQMLVELISCVSQKHQLVAKSQEQVCITRKPADKQKERSACFLKPVTATGSRSVNTNLDGSPEFGNSGVQERHADASECCSVKEGGKDAVDVKSRFAKVVDYQVFACTTSVFVRRIGFSMLNQTSAELLRAGAVNTLIQVSMDAHCKHIKASILLDTLFASDPSSKTPLFLTLQEKSTKIDDSELFGNAEEQSDAFLKKNLTSSSRTTNDQTDKSTSFNFSNSSSRQETDLEEHYLWKMKSEKRDALHVEFESFPHKKLLLTIKASCAIHWQKENIQKILEAVQQSRELIDNFIKKQLELLDYQKQSGVTIKNGEHSLSSDATDALYYTFTLLDEWLHLSLNDNAMSSNQRNLNNEKDTPLTNNSKGLPCLNANGSLPNFPNNFASTIAFTCHIQLHTASFIFYSLRKKFAESSLSGITLEYTKYQSHDAELKIFIQNLNLHLKKKCILSSGSVCDWQKLNKAASDIECKPCEKPSPLFQMHMKFYKSSQIHTEHNMVYSSCFSSYLSNLTYVYYQKDVSQLYAYLCDGILDVILRKSYQVAYKLAQSSFCLFGLYIKDAVVLVPEDKSCIAQSLFYVEKQSVDTTDESTDFGSLIEFRVSSLSVRNSYTCHSTPQGFTQNTLIQNERSKYLTTLHFDLKGLTAFMRHSEKFKSFSKDINGQILQSIDGCGTLQGGELIVIDARLSQFHLSMIREQLTLLLDILNENFSGLGYQPNDIELGCHDFLSRNNEFSSCGALDQCMTSTNCSEENLIVEHLKELFCKKSFNTFNQCRLVAIPPVCVSCRVCVDSINLHLAFSQDKPLALCITRNNCFACDVSLYGLYLTYQFSFLAESFVVEDIRQGSLNRYKRFLECFSVSDAMTLGENSRYTCNGTPQGKYEYQYGDELPGTNLQWMRPGIELKPLMPLNDSNSEKSYEHEKVIHESISISFANNVKTTRLSASLWNPNLFLFTVGMQDVLNFVVASFSFSTMRRYPKPIAMVVPKIEKKASDEKTLRELIEAKLKSMIPSMRPFLIDVTIKQGVFNFFSQLETLSDPIIQVKGDFNFKAQSMENYLLFNLIQLHDCIISKVMIMPFQDVTESTGIFHQNMSPHLHYTLTTSNVCNPLFKVLSSVVINKAFSIKATGLLETLFDVVTKIWYPSKANLLHDENQTKEQTVQFSFSEMASPVMKESCMNQISLFTLHVEMPECVLHLSIQDFVVLCCALRNINGDHVSIYSKVPYPPIVAVDATLVDSLSTTHSTVLQQTKNDNEFKSKVIGNESYSQMKISCDGLRVVMFDDRLTMPTPILKCSIVATCIKLCSDPNKFLVKFHNMLLNVDFMSDGGSAWQPFIEEFNVSWCFETNVNNSTLTCASETTLPDGKDSTLNICKKTGGSLLTVQEERVKLDFHESKSKTGSELKPFNEEWNGFVPCHSLCLLSNKALLINVTPYLCQLLRWFGSSLQETFEHFFNKRNVKSDKKRDNNALTETNGTHLCIGNIQCNSERTYSYMNLTGENFLAFSINSEWKRVKEENIFNREGRSGSGLPPASSKEKSSIKDNRLYEENVSFLKIDSSQQLIPTNVPKTLDHLAVSHFTDQFQFSKRSAQEFEIFVVSEIPKKTLERLKKQLPLVPDRLLLTSLYETRNERVTLNSFLSISQPNSTLELKPTQVEDILKNQGIPAPYLGEFPRRMQVVPIVLSRADTKLIPIDFETLAGSYPQQLSSKSLHQRTTLGLNSFIKKPKMVARVLSTHPSYKLLMLTTCILLENHTGFPLQISFLYNGHEPILMRHPEKYCTPCSSLQGSISNNTCSSKSAPLQPTCIQSKRQLQYPELNDSVTHEKMLSFNANKLSYSVCLLNDHLLSIPPEVFIHQERVVFSFRPAYMEPLLHVSSSSNADTPIPTITVDQGWTALLDVNCADRSKHARQPYIRSCRIPSDPSAVINRNTPECVKRNILKSCKTKQIHMSVIMSESKLSTAEDASLYNLKIFPGFTIVNACPILLNCHLYLDGKSINQKISNDLETTKVHIKDGSLNNPLLCAAKENLYLSISPFTIYHVLSIHPWADKASLRMRLRFTLISEAEWSKSVKFSSIQEKDDVMSRLPLNCGSLSCIEIEVYKTPYHFLSDNEILSKQQKGCLLSCPRWLVNRTNVNLSILDPTSTYMNVFPIVDNICLLGNSKKTEIQLVHTVPGDVSKRVVRSEKFSSFVEIPAVGGFSNAFLQTNTLYYVFTLETVHLTLKDVYNATLRCVTICPKYIFINTFNDKTIYLRQVTNDARSHHSTKCTDCSPNTSLPLYWTQSSNPLCFQFKIGDSYAWSGSICPHDEYVGGHDIAVYDKKQFLWDLFHIQIIVEKGKFFIVIRSISDPMRSPLHSVFLSNHLDGITAYFHTYHTRSTACSVGEKSTKKNQAEFEIPSHETRLVAWPFPFAYDELNCDVALMTEAKQFLRAPATFSVNLRSNCHRRCLEIKNIPLPSRCFVIIVTRGNTITIDIAMETMGLSRGDSLLVSALKTSTVALLRQDSHRHLLKMKNQNDTIKPPSSLQITFYFSQIGLSCVSALLRQELLYAEVSSVCGALLQQNDNQLFEFSIKTLQMDSQLEECKRCVFLAQRDQKEKTKNAIKHPTSPYHQILCSLWYTKPYLVFSTVLQEKDSFSVFEKDICQSKNPSSTNFQTMTSVFSENKKKGPSPTNVFFHIWVERESISNSDLFLKDVEITLGDLELDLDAEMLNGLQIFSQECLDVFGITDTSRLTVSEAVAWNQTMTENSIQPPILGKSVTLKQLNISKFSVFVWCSLLLDKLDFLSDFLKLALRILMVSPILELTAAPITFQNEIVNNSIRGSLLTLLTVMRARYLHQLVSSLGAVLGYSSLANIPRAPLDLFRGTVGLGLTVADNVSSGLGTVLSNLTFDTDYITRREQALCHTPNTVKDGLVTASKDLKEGFISLGEVVTKTIGGAQKGGFPGFLRGLGKGVAGTIIKPVDKLSQAISNVAFGIRAEYGAGYEKSKKMCTERRRKPRLLSGTTGMIMKYDPQQAELRECLSIQESKDILCSISLIDTIVSGGQNSLILIYAKQIRLVRLICRQRSPHVKNCETCGGVNPLLPSTATITSSGNGTLARLIWTLNTSDILTVRASSNGVMIRTNENVFQIPCNDGEIIKRLYEEIVKSQQRTKCSLNVENIADWIGASNEI